MQIGINKLVSHTKKKESDEKFKNCHQRKEIAFFVSTDGVYQKNEYPIPKPIIL